MYGSYTCRNRVHFILALMLILKIEHIDFHVRVDVRGEYAGGTFRNLYKRAQTKHIPANFTTTYSFSDPERVMRCELWDPELGVTIPAKLNEKLHPVFFEQVPYTFTIEFLGDITMPAIYSRDKQTEKAFEKQTIGLEDMEFDILTGNPVFNDLGSVDLVLYYKKGTVPYNVILHFDIFSTKLDTKKDVPCMVKDIEIAYPNMAIDYIKNTYVNFEIIEGQRTDLSWWIIFDNIYRNIMGALEQIIAHPYVSTVRSTTFKKARQIRKPGPLLWARMLRYEGNPHHHFEVPQRKTLEDNYENGVAKYILREVLEKFNAIYSLVLKQELDKRMTRTYKQQLEFVQKALESLYKQRFFATITERAPYSQNSHVLTTAAGYVALLDCWNKLNSGYRLFGGLYQIELKRASYLYQLWCFLGLAAMIRKLGGKQMNILKMPEIVNEQLLIMPNGSMNALLEFKFENGIIVELYHELLYNDIPNDNGALTVTGSVKPDIVMRISKQDLPDNLYLTYLFDAKYRLGNEVNGADQPVQEDINQMHRYRDAIYFKDERYRDLSKDIMGAYVLYPGKGNRVQMEVDYQRMIAGVNIGGFTFVPGASEENQLLEQHLQQLFEKSSAELLAEVHRQKGKRYEPDQAYVFVPFIPKTEEGMRLYLEKNKEVFFPHPKFLSALGNGLLRYVAPYIEGSGISYFYEIASHDWKPRRDVYPPHHPMHKGSRKCLVLKLVRKTYLPFVVQIKGRVRNERFTNIKYLNSAVNGFISTIPENKVV